MVFGPSSAGAVGGRFCWSEVGAGYDKVDSVRYGLLGNGGGDVVRGLLCATCYYWVERIWNHI